MTTTWNDGREKPSTPRWMENGCAPVKESGAQTSNNAQKNFHRKVEKERKNWRSYWVVAQVSLFCDLFSPSLGIHKIQLQTWARKYVRSTSFWMGSFTAESVRRRWMAPKECIFSTSFITAGCPSFRFCREPHAGLSLTIREGANLINSFSENERKIRANKAGSSLPLGQSVNQFDCLINRHC